MELDIFLGGSIMKKKLWCALWTPTDSNGHLLKKEIKAHLRFLEQNKVDGILVGGSTGEFIYLDLPTRKELLQFVLENRGSLEVIFNLSHPEPKAVKELAHFTNPLPLSGVLLLPPIFYPISQPDIAAYFIHMAPFIKHPLYLYNFPELTHATISLEAIEEICKQVPVAGIKMSGGDLAYLKSVAHWAQGKKFIAYTGNDAQLPETLQMGVQGCMGGLVNVIPELLVQALQTGGAELKPRLQQLGKILAKLNFPLNVAAFMEARHFPPGAHKMPMSPATAAEYKKSVEEFTRWLAENK
jgi:4-hydroxy-tetrahydrodipicolinate synthase